ncbi:MAG: type ISP restriction/modification enzyme [Rikenellaceae bacterium]
MTIRDYIIELNKQYATCSATEHSYRPALKSLLESILPTSITVINEPKRSECGAPDYILQQKDNIPVAFLEAKDFAKSNDLGGRKENKEQFDRYKKSLDNIIFTDYLDFWLYENGEFVDNVKIADIKGDKIVATEDSEAKFKSLINHLANAQPQKITSSSRLAEIMAGKARLLADVTCKAILQDGDINSQLCGWMKSFRDVLISDITPESFADIYAQTIAYGMFAARLHDTTPEDFSRQEASNLIPKTNPFLRQIFQYIAGYDLDKRIAWIVDDLAKVFSVTNINKIMQGYGERTRQVDPILHFYEDFLSAYDPALREKLGVWYTPQPIVSYIVRSVDEILQKEFNLPMGLADTTKIKIKKEAEQSRDKRFKGGRKTYLEEYHKVQILDPATGTGTFLAEIVQAIYDKYKNQQGLWQSYVEDHLLPRLNGFEILMASYAMAHLKLDMLLHDTGYVPTNDERFKIYLTNSLEEHHPDTGSLFVQELANEANYANHIKRDAPVMVIMGNPPYSSISNNKGTWMKNLIDDYKYINGIHFREKKHWLNDDYVKFIRLGQSFVERNSEGVLAYINNHGFLDNPTFRGMRWNLLSSFDKIYIIDLHGNSKRKEVCPDGSKDDNVFDIQQGVSINIFVKNSTKVKGKLADVYHLDLYGKRRSKYDFLSTHSLNDTNFTKLEPNEPFYFFVPKNDKGRAKYEDGFSVNDLFVLNTSGIVTARDSLVVDTDKSVLFDRINTFCNPLLSDREIRTLFWGNKKDGKYLAGDTRGWRLAEARKKISSLNHKDIIKKISYRPFDVRYIYYHQDMVDWGRQNVMKHLLTDNNLGLITARSNKSDICDHFFISKNIVETKCGERTTQSTTFPLYIYNIDNQTLMDISVRTPNLKVEIIEGIASRTGLIFEAEKSGNADKFAPIDLLDYIYGVLHTPAYREQYKEFLKVDFPRIPYPESAEQMFSIATIGGELRRIHLMDELPPIITPFLIDGDNGSNIVETISAKQSVTEGQLDIYINDTQYFSGVPLTAWNHYIGGYQPAQKWLKDRKGKKLTFDDLQHYQRIIAALVRTAELMDKL